MLILLSAVTFFLIFGCTGHVGSWFLNRDGTVSSAVEAQSQPLDCGGVQNLVFSMSMSLQDHCHHLGLILIRSFWDYQTPLNYSPCSTLALLSVLLQWKHKPDQISFVLRVISKFFSRLPAYWLLPFISPVPGCPSVSSWTAPLHMPYISVILSQVQLRSLQSLCKSMLSILSHSQVSVLCLTT